LLVKPLLTKQVYLYMAQTELAYMCDKTKTKSKQNQKLNLQIVLITAQYSTLTFVLLAL